jgi:hypothetical protein
LRVAKQFEFGAKLWPGRQQFTAYRRPKNLDVHQNELVLGFRRF